MSRVLASIFMGILLTACGGSGRGGDDGGSTPPPNAAPTITSTSFEVTQDTQLSAMLTAVDPEADTITFGKRSDPSSGQLVSFAAGGAFTYRPNAGFVGTDRFAVSASDGRHEVSATVTLTVLAAGADPQTLTFTQPGPLSMFVGDTLSNPARAPGTGAVAYSSSDPAVATVDETGSITVLGTGSVQILADKAADEHYLAAQASYTLTSVEAQVPISAWVGATLSEVSVPPTAAGLSFYRSSAPGCDLANYTRCADGQLDYLNTSPVMDTAATLSRPGYYSLRHGDAVASLEINARKFIPRDAHQVVVFRNRLWLVGGRDDVDFSNTENDDVWSSADGVTWTEQTAQAGFSLRNGHRVVVFKDRLWVIGGHGYDGTHKNDVWSSTDGITWIEQTAQAEFSPRGAHEVVVFRDQLWLIGGSDGVYRNDVWRSVDGINWQLGLHHTFDFRDRE